MNSNDLYNALRHIKIGKNIPLYTQEYCETLVPLINDINQLKREKNAIILAHSYVNPEILHAVADFTGDSFELSKQAKTTDADIIVFSAVKFMAETAKLLNPNKVVLVPSKVNGCSLADSITASEVRALKSTHPEYTFICYINTSAGVKAECDVTVTSSNVYDIVANHPNQYIYFLPDKLMAQNIILEMECRNIQKTIKYTDGSCYVHEEYTSDMIDYIRLKNPNVSVVCHPECSSDIINSSDFVGSTSQMIRYVETTNAPAYFLLTECGLSSRLQLEYPEKQFIGTCTLCRYMKSNSLNQIKRVLQSPDPQDIISIEPTIQARASDCINAMFEYSNQQSTVTRS